MIHIFHRGGLINLAVVAPGALIKQRVIRRGSGILLRNDKTTRAVEEVGMRLITRIQEMDIALVDA